MSGLINAVVLVGVSFLVAHLTGQKATIGFFTCAFAAGTYMVACEIRSMLRQEQGK